MSKTEVSGKQIKDGTIDLVDLAPAVATDIGDLKTNVTTLQGDVGNLQNDVSGIDSTSSSQIAALDGRIDALEADPVTKTYVDQKVADLVSSAPAVLDTLKELSDALGGDENFSATISGQLSDITTDVAALQTDLQAEVSRAQGIESAIDGRVDTLEIAVNVTAGDVSSLDARITTIENAPAGPSALLHLTDVSLASPAAGEVLKYNGTAWVNGTDNTFSGAYADLTGKPTLFSGAYSDLTGKPSLFSGAYADLSGKPTLVSALDDLSDVTVSTPSNGQVLQYNGTAWVNGAAPSTFSGSYTDLTNKPTIPSAIDDLSDVTITSAAKGQFIAHNGTNFVNTRTIEADVAATVPLTLKGAASQSGNLFQIKDSADADILYVRATPLNLFGQARLVVNSPTQTSALWLGSGNVSSLGAGQHATAINFNGSGVSHGVLAYYPNGSASGLFRFHAASGGGLDGSNNPANGSLGVSNIFANTNGNTLGSTTVTTTAAATKALIVKGAASQTANLFEVQDSAGTAFVSVNGNFGTSLKSSAAATASLTITPGASAFAEGNAPALVINRNDGAAALIVDAMGGVLAFNKNNARLSNYMIDGYGPNIFNSDSGSLNLRAVAAKKINFVTPDEGYSARSLSFYHGASIGDGFSTPKWYQDCNGHNISVLTTGFGINVPIGTALGAQFHLINGAAARKGVVIRGAASQSANLIELQNSSGTVIFSVDSSGSVSAGTIPVARVTGLATVATSGSYNDLSDKPTVPSLTGYATESYVNSAVSSLVNSAPSALDTLNELATALGNDANFATTMTNALAAKADSASLADVATSGSYDDLSNKPTLGSFTTLTSPASGQFLKYNGTAWVNSAVAYSDVTGTPSLATVATSGSYDDLSNKPSLFDGAYSSLTGAPSLATVATSGSYADLSNKPTIPGTSDGNALGATTITTTAAATKALVVKGATSQTANILEVEHSTGTNIFAVTPSQIETTFNGITSTETNATVTTSDATETTLFSLTLADNTTYNLDVMVCARLSSTTAKGMYGRSRLMVYRNNGGAATVAVDFGGQLEELDSYGSSGYDYVVDVSGNDVRVRVTGAASETVKWAANVKYVSVS
jgi:hypothetical protein